jgi:WD40 repeat protein
LSTLRGHSGPIYSITGSSRTDKSLAKILFTAGDEGSIRIWNIPELPKDEKYPELKGRNFMVGLFNDGVKEPYWHLSTNSFHDIILAIK